MNKIFLVAQREYLENVRTKAFWLGIFLVPILYTAMFLGPAWIEKSKSAKKFAVVDESGWLLDAVEARVLTDDLTRVLMEVGEAADEGKSLTDYPAFLAEAAPALSALEPAGIAALVPGLIDPARSVPDMPAALDGERDALVRWWQELPEDEVRRLFDGTSRNRFVRVAAPEDTEQLNQRIVNESLFAYFVIGADPVKGSEGAKYVSQNLTDDDLEAWFSRYAGALVRERRLQQEQIDATVAAWIQAPYNFGGRKLTASGEEAEISVQDKVRQWAPAAFVYLLWLSVFTISNMLMTNTIEEKSNRLIEVLLSSMSPIQLMAGKMTGIAWTGLTVVGTWIACVIAGTELLPRLLGVQLPFDLGQIISDPAFMVSFGVYFVLGYLLYGSILVGLGSVFNSLKEAQALMGPVMILLFIPLILMIPISEDPNSLLAKILSYVPPLTPFVMMNRAAGPPSMMEYAITSALLLASVFAALWASAKIFRIGILLTGKPPKLREIIRWIGAPVGQIPNREEEEPTT